jgi:hypothetical protein
MQVPATKMIRMLPVHFNNLKIRAMLPSNGQDETYDAKSRQTSQSHCKGRNPSHVQDDGL